MIPFEELSQALEAYRRRRAEGQPAGAQNAPPPLPQAPFPEETGEISVDDVIEDHPEG